MSTGRYLLRLFCIAVLGATFMPFRVLGILIAQAVLFTRSGYKEGMHFWASASEGQDV